MTLGGAGGDDALQSCSRCFQLGGAENAGQLWLLTRQTTLFFLTRLECIPSYWARGETRLTKTDMETLSRLSTA